MTAGAFIRYLDIGVAIARSINMVTQIRKMEHEHSPDAIRKRLDSGPTHNYLRDWIDGEIDGAVTTFAVVSGVAGAQLSPWIILALGLPTCLPMVSQCRPVTIWAPGPNMTIGGD